jgi:hypothetical protein
MSARINKFKKKTHAGDAELSEEERKKQYENYLTYVSDSTDNIICQYLSKINDYAIGEIFGKNESSKSVGTSQEASKSVGTSQAGMSFDGTTNKYEIKFVIVNDENKYSLTKPNDVKPEVFKEVVNHMDTLIRSGLVFKKRFEQYLNYQNTRKNPPKVELVSGCKLFLRSDKNLYYIGNKSMSDEHIAFVQKMRVLPISIGLAVNKL